MIYLKEDQIKLFCLLYCYMFVFILEGGGIFVFYLCNKCLLGIIYVLGIIVGVRDIVESKVNDMFLRSFFFGRKYKVNK